MRAVMRWAPVVMSVALGLAPGVASGQTFEIQAIEINQALGVQKDNALKFVAGKDTVIRAFLSAAVAIDPGGTAVEVIREGESIAALRPNSYGDPTAVVDFLCPSRAACGHWAAGSYRFDVRVNGVTKSTSGTTYLFVERREIRVLALPVKANYGGVVTQVLDDGWKKIGGFAESVYPVAAAKFDWSVRDELDASGPQYDLETDEGQAGLWQALKDLMPVHCTANPSAAGCFDIIIGFISDRPKGYPNGTLQGYTYGKPVNIVVAKDEDAPATVAHEIGHLYGIGDTYDGGSFRCSANPAPDSFSGKDWDDRTKTVQCTAGRTALEGVSSTKVPADHHAYDVGGRGALGDVASYMGSGGQQAQFWAAQDDYDWIFDRSSPGAASSEQLRSAAADQRLLEFTGYIREDPNSAADVTLHPWEAFMDSAAVPDTAGVLVVAALGAAGERLATQALSVQHVLPGSKGTPPRRINPAPFEGVIRFPEGTRKFQLLKNSTVITERLVSANAPTIRDVSPTSRSTVNGVFSIRWTASDQDGDRLTYRVEYNADVTRPDSDWEILGTTSDPQWTEDFGDLPGGDHAKLRVIVTDGILSAQAESSEFLVPAKPPEVFIDAPVGGSTFRTGQEVHFEAEVFDLQDDDLPDASLQWSSDVAGPLGTGPILTIYNLAVGTHIIALRATNRAGLTTAATVTIHVQAR